MRYGFGVDLGGTTVKIAYFNEEGTLLDKWEIPTRTQDSGKHILPDIAQAIDGYITREQIDRKNLIGIGIGVPGPVSGEGIVNKCINLGWGVFNIREALSALTGLPVEAGNDATVAALGESWMGGGKGCKDMIFATLGTGVGGGIVANGHVILGAHGAGGEIGHMVLRKNETVACSCGKYGCVEQYCSATGIVRMGKAAFENRKKETILTDHMSCKDIFDAGKAGDALALEILEQYYDCLGEFLGNLACVVNPAYIVLGGGVSKAGQPLLDGAKKYFEKYAFHACKDVCFRLAALGNDAGAYGAFKLILDKAV